MTRSLLLAVALSATALAIAQEKKPAPFERWEKAIRAMEKADKAKAPPEGAIFFCGSSSIVRWDLAKSFPGLKVVGRGFGGSQIADSTHFAPRIILPYRPATIVFYAGDNDINAGKGPARVRDDFKAFVKVIHAKLPETRILFLAIKPSPSRWKHIEKIRKANALIEAVCKEGKRLEFVDVATPMIGRDGKPTAGLYAKDQLHLSPEGYKLWTGIVRRRLAADR